MKRSTCWVGAAAVLYGCGTNWDGPDADSIELAVDVHEDLIARIAELREAGAVGANGEVPDFLDWDQLGFVARVHNNGEQPLMIEVTRFSPESTELEFLRCQMRSQSGGLGKLSFAPGSSHDYGNAPFDTGIECDGGKAAPGRLVPGLIRATIPAA